MRISKRLGISATQYELDFLDVDMDIDNELFIDPFLIANSNSAFAAEANTTINSFFSRFKNVMQDGDYDEASRMFRYMSEPKENCLGISSRGTKNGRGVGELDTQKILNKIIKSDAINKGLVNKIEDLVIFVDDIGKDKLSDMVTNIIRLNLTKYTQQQCELWGIEQVTSETLPYWDVEKCEWTNSVQKLLVINSDEYLLIPKSVVTPLNIYELSKYNNSQIIEQERAFHLRRNSELVHYKLKKDGTQVPYVIKEDVKKYTNNKIKKDGYISKKEFIREYTLKYPDLFTRFISDAKRKIEPLSNEKIVKKLEGCSAEEVIDKLINRLKSIPSGAEHATDYHYLIRSLLSMLWYPHLVNPIVEAEIHDGRKRIDIVMENNANRDFFYRMHAIQKIFCPYIYIECKNYGSDVANPEIDQLAGRFSVMRGQLGILACRKLNDYDKFVKRCRDTYNDGRGLIICITDDDIIDMLNFIKDDSESEVMRLMDRKKQEIVLS